MISYEFQVWKRLLCYIHVKTILRSRKIGTFQNTYELEYFYGLSPQLTIKNTDYQAGKL